MQQGDSSSSSSSSQEGFSVRAVISIHPILKVRNALPESISISILAADVEERSEVALTSGELLPDQVLFLYSVDRRTALGLLVSTPSIGQVKQPALIFHPQGNPLSESMHLLDQRGRSLFLGLDYEQSVLGDMTVTIFPPLLVLNRSGVGLFYAHATSDSLGNVTRTPAAGQNIDMQQGDSSSSSSSSQDPAALLGPIEADFPTDAFTGVKFKSEAELMVERGEARDVNHARKIIRDRLGMKNDPDTKHLDRVAVALQPESERILRVKTTSVGRLIGAGGANIKNLQQEARKIDPHAEIRIKEDRKDAQVHEVNTSGSKEATEFVVETIKNRLKEGVLSVS
mmetsp:Transcript_31289/g.70444  ORF Transcript_31289/g.70444 Transcript_31289/m.70444 type:complete len:341 (-) Transcript_31289:78-1100(-)